MEDIDETDTVEIQDSNCGSRKRRSTGGKRVLAKMAKYSRIRNCNVIKPCAHNTKNFRCSRVTPNHVAKIRENLCSVPEKLVQDGIISSLIQTQEVKRRRPREKLNKKVVSSHSYNVKYFLITDFQRVPVCKSFFIEVTKIGRTRLQNIAKKQFCGDSLKENRGGDRKSHLSQEKKESVKKFIGKLRGTESHYGRNKSKRIYLMAGLSIKKLHKIYNENTTDEFKVKHSMFRRIFVNNFNIGFKSPATDVCSHCTILNHKIKSFPKGSKERNDFIIEKRIHKKRANAFYELMRKDVDDSISYCFDLQQILPLPKTPVQEAYYSRQIGFYNFCIVDLKGLNPKFYCWSEEQAGKGSTEISSALLHFLQNTDFQSRRILRLFSDGCVAQNKNNIIVRTILYFMQTHTTSPTEIHMHFPTRGHSFLPADRVFGRAEKVLRNKQTIIEKEEYMEIYKELGHLYVLGHDWELKDTKDLKKYYKDLRNISNMKRIFFKVSEVNGKRSVRVKAMENFYYEGDEVYQSLNKKSFTNTMLSRMIPQTLALRRSLTDEKKKDVDKLLQAVFGNWQELDDNRFKWYKELLFNTPTVSEEIIDAENECDCLDQENCIRI